jgi:hypothetical protein
MQINWCNQAGRTYLILNNVNTKSYFRAMFGCGFRTVAQKPYPDEQTHLGEAEARAWLLQRAGVTEAIANQSTGES